MTKLFIYITILTVATSPYIDYVEKMKEGLVFCVCILLGSGALIGFNSRERTITMKEIFVSLMLSFFVGTIAHIAMTNFNLVKWRVIVVMIAAFMSEWVLNWLKNRYPKIFDWGFKRITNKELKDDDNRDS